MIVYYKDNQLFGDIPVTSSAEHEEELMKSDFVKLSWNDAEKYTIPVDAYIIPFTDNVKYYLFEPYEPEQKSEAEFKYEPTFMHEKMYISKVAFTKASKDADNNDITLLDWTYTGYVEALLEEFVTQIASIFGRDFHAEILGVTNDIVTISFSMNDIMSALTILANAVECEWHLDWEDSCLYFGHISYGEIKTLEVGENVNVPSTRNSKEGYWNAFLAQGSTRNITRKAQSGENVQSSVRLSLDNTAYPDGIMYSLGEFDNENHLVVYNKSQFDAKGVKPYIKSVVFEEVYPKQDLYVYDVKYREKNLTDENNVIIGRYATWYVKLAYKDNGTWKDFDIKNEVNLQYDGTYTLDEDYDEVWWANLKTRYKDAYYGTADVHNSKVSIGGQSFDAMLTKGQDTYLYVDIGPFDTRSEAESYCNGLHSGDWITVMGNAVGKFPEDKRNSQIVDGKRPIIAFQPNKSSGAMDCPLAGRGSGDGNGHYGFKVRYLKLEGEGYITQANTIQEEGDTGILDMSGERSRVDESYYEIEYEQDNNFVMPTTIENGIYPKGAATPAITNNLVNMYNVALSNDIVRAASGELADKTKEYIEDLYTDDNSYTVKSNPEVFERNNPHLHIGETVRYVNGDYILETRVMKLVTKLDYDFEQEITVGNEVLKGQQQQLREKVDNIITAGASGGSGGSGSGGAVSESAVIKIVKNWVTPRFLSKIEEDVAEEPIGFLKGLWVQAKDLFGIAESGAAKVLNLLVNGTWGIAEDGTTTLGDTTAESVETSDIHSEDYDDDMLSGKGYHIYDDNGTGHIVTDILDVRKKARFTELEIRKLSYINAENVQSDAASKIEQVFAVMPSGNVVPLSEATGTVLAYRCLAVADDGTTATTNSWKVGDQAWCQSFNIAAPGSYTNVSNRIYRRLVVKQGQCLDDGTIYTGSASLPEDYDGKIHHFVDLANVANVHQGAYSEWNDIFTEANNGSYGTDTYTDFIGYDTTFENDVPAPDDAIVQMGHQFDTERMGFYITKAAGPNTGPYIYAGVNSFDVSGKMITKITPAEVLISAKKLKVFSDPNAGDAVPIVRYKGSWTDGSESYFYDEWDYNGNRWLCIDETHNPVTEAPGTTPAYWRLANQKGDPGDNGYSTATVQLFKRFADGETLDKPTGILTYTFADGVLSGNTSYFNGWSQTIPNPDGNKKLYVTMATASSRSATDDIESNEWSGAVEYVKDGAQGEHGINSCPVVIYKRNASRPENNDKPNNVYYYFSNGKFYTNAAHTTLATSDLNGWSTEIPSGTNPCWRRHATAANTTETDLIESNEWSGAEKFVENGKNGDNGDTPIQLFKWSQTPLTANDKPTVTAAQWATQDPYSGWYKHAQNRPSGDNYNLYLSQNTLNGDGTINSTAWSTPIQISGVNGTPGEDADNVEWVYKFDNTGYNNQYGEKDPSGAARSITDNKNQKNWVPNGWYDKAQPISKDNPILYASYREITVNGQTKTYGDFQTPIVWSHWGRNGIDGDGVEYVFIRTQNNVPPVMNSTQTGYESEEFKPTITSASQIASATEQAQTTDDPKGTNETYKYEWAAKRTMTDPDANGHRTWTEFKGENNDYKMSLWSNYAESNLVVDIDNDADQFGTDSDGVVTPSPQVRTTEVSLFYGTTAQVLNADDAATPGVQASLYYEDDTAVPTSVAQITKCQRNTSDTTKGEVDVTIKAGTFPSAHSGIYAQITCSCVRGSRSVSFTIQQVKSGAPGVAPDICNLRPTAKSINFSKSQQQGSTRKALGCGYTLVTSSGTTNVFTAESVSVNGTTYYIYWRYEGGTYAKLTSTSSIYATGIAPSTTETGVEFCLSSATQASGITSANTLDYEKVPILKDGMDSTVPGPAGKDSIIVDLDNQHEDFLYNDAGTNITGVVTSQARLYDGGVLVTSSDITWEVSHNGGYSYIAASDYYNSGTVAKVKISSDGLLSIAEIYQQTAKVSVRAFYKNEYYYTEFTGSKTSQDKYELTLNPNAIAYNPATFVDTTITASATRLDLAGTKSAATISSRAREGLIRLFAKYITNVAPNQWAMYEKQITTGSFVVKASDTPGSDYAPASKNSGIYFELRKYADVNGGNSTSYAVVDYETVPIAKVENGGTGTSGADGWMVTPSPANVIITQSLGTDTNTFSTQAVTFTAKKGNVSATVASLGTPSWNHFTGSKNGTTITVTAPTRDSSNNYYTEGYFTVNVNVTDPDGNGTVTFNVKVPCYANLLGTWKETVENDTKTEVASMKFYTYDKDGQVVSQETIGEYIRSSSMLSSSLQSTVNSQGSEITSLNTSVESARQSVDDMQTEVNGVKTSVSSVVRESDRISQKVYQTNLFENSDLLPAADNTASHYAPTGWTVGSNYAILEKPYVGGSHLAYITYSGGDFYQGVWGSTAAKKKLVPGKWHTVTFYAKITGKMRVTFVGMATTGSTWYIENYVYLNGVKTNLSNDSGNSSRKYVEITPTDSNTYIKYDVQFFVKSTMTSRTGSGYINFTAPSSGNQVYLASPQLYEGMATGIDIANRKIDVIADNFNIWNNNGEKSMGVDESGNVEFGGTIRSANIYHSVCYFIQGGTHVDENGESWRYCSSTSAVSQYNFEVGKYYNLKQVKEITGGQYSDFPNGFVACSYKADIINMIPKTTNWTKQTGEADSILTAILPLPKDFPGKIVEVFALSKSAEVKTVHVSCIDTTRIAEGYIYWDTQYSKLTLSSIGSNGYFTMSTGSRMMLMSVKADDQYYWIIVSSTNYN